MAEGSDMSEETKLLQEKLGSLDSETLRGLLQTVVANKTKESEKSNVVDQTEDDKTTENEALNNQTTDDDDDIEVQVNLQDGANEQNQITEHGTSAHLESAVMQSGTMSEEAIRNEVISVPNTLVNDIKTMQIQQEPKSEPTPNTSNNATSSDFTSLAHQNTPVFIPETFNQPGNFNGENTQTAQDLKPAGDYNIQPGNTLPNDPLNVSSNQPSTNFDQPSGFDQKPVTADAEQQSKLNYPVSLPTASNPPSSSVDQQNGQIFQHGNNSPYTPVTLPSNQSPMHPDQQIGHGPKPVVTQATVVPTTQQSLPSGTLPTASQSPSSFDQKIGYGPNLTPVGKTLTQTTQSMATNNPFSSPTAASPSSNFDQPTGYGMVSYSKEQVNHPDKGSPFGQFNAPSKPSPTSFYHVGQHDQKPGMAHSKVHQPNESLPTYQFKPPSKPPPSSFDQNHQSHTTPVVTSSTYDPQDISFHDFPSAVPPLTIPLSKIGQYLPPGVELDNSETRIPLALKPVIVVKDQVALMVFEHDNGMRKECNKQQLLLEEQATTQLPIQRQNATYMKQQPPQMLKEQQVQNENQFQQFGPYDETLHQVNHATDSSQGQASAAPSIQQQQPVQDYQQQHQQNEQQQMQQQRQQQNQQQQEQQKQVQQQQQQQQQMQQQQQQQIQQQQQQQMQQQRQQIEQQRQQQSYNHTPEYDNPQFQNFDRPRFPSTSSSIQYQEQQQPILSSFPEFSHQDPSRSQQVHRSTSLPYIATSTSIQQTNNQQSQQQSNSLPGLQPPIWMSDEHCKSCTNCGKSFSITRRKHHCRGCGKIFCNECCDQLAQLPYLGRKVARICITCTKLIKKAHADRDKRKKEEKSRRHSQSVLEPRRPAVNNSLMFIPSENVVPVSQTRSQPVIPESNFNVPQSTSDAYQTSTSPVGNFNPVKDATPFVPDVSAQPSPSYSDRMSVSARSDSTRGYSQDNGFVGNSWKIPPRPAGRTITWTDYNPNTALDEQRKRFKNLNKVLKTPEGAVIQAATKLSITARKIQVVVKQELHEAWFLCSVGFASCDQEEIAFILEKRIAEDVFPYEMLKVYRTLYSLVLNQGERFVHGNYLAFNNPVLGSRDNAGFLFITLDKAPKLIHHHAPRKALLIGILIKQAELLCTKYVPTRLLNALGAQQQCFPSPALSSRDRSSACNIEPNELFYSTFYAVNQFLNHKMPQAMIPDVHILKSGSKVVLELPFSYQTEVISILDSLLVDESQPVAVPIAGDLVPEANGHFLYTSTNTTSARRGFVVLQNSNEKLETGNQYLAFSAILLVLTFGDACNSRTRFGIEVVEDGIKVTFSDSQAKEIRQAIYQGTNCAMSVGTSADSREEFTLRWTGDTCPSILDVPTPIRVVPSVKKPSKGYFPATTAGPSVPRAEAGQTNVIIDRVKTRDIEAAIPRRITSQNPQQSVNKLENDVRQACGGCLLTFANRLKFNAEKRINLTLSLGPGNYKKWSLGPNNQPINLARSLQLALNEIDVPDVNDEIVFVFNVILQKKN